MTSIFVRNELVPCTVIETHDCVITQIKTQEIDGYDAVQLACDEKKEKNTSNALKGHFKKAGVSSKKRIIEFRGFLQAYGGEPLKLGDVIKATDVFEEEEFIDAVGISRGKGFCGVMKRHGFKGAKESSHGQKHTNRAPGSVGEKGGAKVLKNTRMGGRTGGEQVKVKNLEVLKIIPEENIMVLKGSIPGARENYIILQK